MIGEGCVGIGVEIGGVTSSVICIGTGGGRVIGTKGGGEGGMGALMAEK